MNRTFLSRATASLLSLLLTVSLITPSAAAEGDPAPVEVDPAPVLTGVTVNLSNAGPLALVSGSPTSVTASVTPEPSDAPLPDDLVYQWTPVERNVVEVTPVSDGSGNSVYMSAGTPGETTVAVTVSSKKCPGITVTPATCKVISSGIRLSHSSLSINKREAPQLVATTFAPDRSVTSVTWSSSNESVVTVTGNSDRATVTGISAGSAYITATLQIDGFLNSFSSECKVTVSEVTANVITGSASADSPLPFYNLTSQMNTQCTRVLGTSLLYVTSLSVPTSVGTLYYGYTSEGEPGSGVGTNENYYYYSSSGDRLLNDIMFVPKTDFSGNAVINYTGFDATGNSFQGTVRVNVAATTGIYYSTVGRSRVDFNVDDFMAVCQSRTGHELQYVSFSLPSQSKGTLFYKYSGSDLDNKVDSVTAYYRSKSPLLSDVTFVAADGYSGTVSISYTGRDSNGNFFSGSVEIAVSNSVGGKGNIHYTTSKNRSVDFDADDFDDLCERELDEHLRYVRFSLPSSTQGTLYYNHYSSSSYGSRVSPFTNYYRNSSPYLDSVSFVPNSGYTGTVSIAFTGYGTNDQRFTGTVTVDVTKTSSSGRLTYTTKKNTAVRFDVDDFNDYCDDQTGRGLNYVRFQLPSSSYGTLYYNYNYSSSSSYGSTVSSSSNYYRHSSPYLDNISFLPASGYSGTVDIDFTGYDTNGERFTGTVRVTVNQTSSSGDITYTTTEDTALNFASEDFDDLCENVTDRRLNYLRFTLPSSSKGTLYYNYSSPSNRGNKISSSSNYYRSTSPYLNNITFVPADGYTGQVDIDFTGYDTSGQRFTGTVHITVKAAASAGIIYYSTTTGKPFSFGLSVFQNACNARGAGSFVSATFSRPSSNAGQLRYQYTSVYEPGSAVSSSASYQASGSPLLSGISFVPTAGYTGAVTFSYTGRDSKGNSYPGTIIITITSTKSNSFTDMGNYGWARSSVEYLYTNGVVNGTGSGKFSPGAQITRGSFMLMLNRAFDFNASGGTGFSDVPANSVYAEAIKITQALGIAQGNGSNFYPKRPLSRQQAAVFLARAMRADGWTISEGSRSELAAFSDVTSISDYAVGPLSALVRMNIFQGGSNGYLNPQAPLTRAQMAVILCRALAL